jgi:hypothetical protein
VSQWTRDEAQLIKRCYATPEGRDALDLIVQRLALYYQSSFNPDTHVTAFNEGRRFVGKALDDMIHKPLSTFQGITDANHNRGRGLTDDGRPVSTTERIERIAAGLATTYRRT